MFKFSFELNDEDYYEFIRHNWYYSPVNRRARIQGWLMCPIILLVLAVVYLILYRYTSVYIDETRNIVFAVYCAVLAILWFASYNKLMDRRLRKNMVRNANAGRLYDNSSTAYSFAESSFSYTTSTRTSEIAYCNIIRVDIEKHAVYLYINLFEAEVLPSRIFSGDEEKERFISFIMKKSGFSGDANSALATRNANK